ncbi:MAG: hypothetical protein ACTS44_01290 [Candidatus Hodgkinia cicadicola]
MLTLMDHELQLSRSLPQDLYETSYFVLTSSVALPHRRSLTVSSTKWAR